MIIKYSKLIVIINHMINLQQLSKESIGFSLSKEQQEALFIYEKLLQEWNQKFNLTAITDPDAIRLKHFYDSLTCLKVIKDENASIIDIGCGAGFPGIPLKIALPKIKLVLVDSVRKKTDFCAEVVDKLGLDNVTILHARAEDIGKDAAYREKFDWAVARAVAALPVLAEYLLPLVHQGGHLLAQKGANITEELSQAKSALAILGGEISHVMEFELPISGEKRSFVKIKKIRSTPEKYPRKAGLPAKKPLK